MARRVVFQLPEGFSKISAGIFLPGGSLLTGHENGYVTKWLPNEASPNILLRASSEVHDLVRGVSGDIFFGCNAGDLYRLSPPPELRPSRILPPTNLKQTRVFRIMEARPGEVIYTSTYGVIKVLRHHSGNWESEQLWGHTDAVFAVAKSPKGLLATGDYHGNIRLWKQSGGRYASIANLSIRSYVSGLAFLKDDLLAAIGNNGVLYFFEQSDAGGAWRNVFKTETSRGQGRAIAVSLDGKRVVAATERELLEVNPAIQTIRSSQLAGTVVSVFPTPEAALVLTANALVRVPWSEFSDDENVVEYEYLKVSLLGNTGYGKTTLASALATGMSGGEMQSTFGRKVWTWGIAQEPYPRRILLNDNGGQEQVVGTLLPWSADSDAVLYFFKQTELAGLDRAVNLHDRMRPLINAHTKSFLVETFVDQKMKGVTDARVQRTLARSGFDRLFRVAATDPAQVAQFRTDFLSSLDWEVARKAVQSEALVSLHTTVRELKDQQQSVLTVSEMKQEYERRRGSSIYLYHLKYLLQRLTDEGEVEYYPDIGDTIVIDDPEFNRLRTEIPILAQDIGGVIDWTGLATEYPDYPTYVAMLDQYYINNHITLDAGLRNLRVFPAFLEQRALRAEEIPDALKTSTILCKRTYAAREDQLPNLLQALFDVKLEPLKLAASEGVLAWGPHALLYFQIERTEGGIEGAQLGIRYKISSSLGDVSARLRRTFEEICDSLYGTPLIVEGD